MVKRPGIYLITNKLTGKVYVGSSQHVPRRLYTHRYLLTRGKHFNMALQATWSAGANFTFEAIEDVSSVTALLEREQYWIDNLHSADGLKGYNTCSLAGTRRGVPQPASVGEKLRSVHLGKPKSAEQRAKMSSASKGKPKSQAHCDKISAAVTLAMADPERRRKQIEYGRMAKPYWAGKNLPDHVTADIKRRTKDRARSADGRLI